MMPTIVRHTASIAVASLLALLPLVASAHTRPRPTPDTIWGAWYVDPLIAISMLASSWLYLRGLRNLWQTMGEGNMISRGQRAAWIGAMISLVVALMSPLDALGGALFSAHMVQHLILFVVTPWLLAYARPGLAMWWGLPRRWRKPVARTVGSNAVLKWLHNAMQSPTVIVLVFTAVLWIWHTPAMYNAALGSDFLHAVEHMSFMAGAFLLWSWLISVQMGFGHRAGNRHGLAIVIVFATVMQSGLLGAILTFARTPLYESHEAYTGSWGFTLLEDQQLAGLLMWVPMGMTFTLVALILFRAWLIASDRQAEKRERAQQPPIPGPISEVTS